VADTAIGAAFREGHVEADGFRIRYSAGGDGPPLIHLHGAGGLRLTAAHDMLAKRHRVIAFEMPGFGNSPANERSRTMPEMALTMAQAAEALSLDRFNLWGTSFGGKAALWLAVQRPELLSALILESPAAIRPEGAAPPQGTPEEMVRALYGHPERLKELPKFDPAIQAKTRPLVMRLMAPSRDPLLDAGMRALATPTLVLFGTLDHVIPPAMGRIYKDLIPNCQLTLPLNRARQLQVCHVHARNQQNHHDRRE